MDHAEGAARGPPCGIDDQILAMWRALRSNPSLDARWAMQVIDRLLDQRPRPAQLPPPGPPAVTSRASVSPGLQLSSGDDGVRALLDVLGGGGPARDADPHGWLPVAFILVVSIAASNAWILLVEVLR